MLKRQPRGIPYVGRVQGSDPGGDRRSFHEERGRVAPEVQVRQDEVPLLDVRRGWADVHHGVGGAARIQP